MTDKPCRTCDGSGAITKVDWPGELSNMYQEPCPDCIHITPDMTDELNIPELRKLHEAATPGPWHRDPLYWTLRQVEKSGVDVAEGMPDETMWPGREDADYICASHDALPALLDAAEERNNLRAESEDVANAFERYKPLTDSLETTAHSLVNAAHERDALKDNLNTLIAEAEEIFGSGGFHAARMERFRQAIATAKEGL